MFTLLQNVFYVNANKITTLVDNENFVTHSLTQVSHQTAHGRVRETETKQKYNTEK